MSAPPDADRPAIPSTTARTLRRLRVALFTGCVLAEALCLLLCVQAHAAVGTLRDRAAPAVLDVQATREALSDAHYAAVRGVGTGGSLLGSPGGQYQNDISAADQSLAQLAADNVAGTSGTSRLRLVEALVVTYNAEIGQTYADHDNATLTTTDLWDASRILEQTLTELGTLDDKESSALRDQRSSMWLARETDLLWVLPVLLLLALFLVTRSVVSRRFRRSLSWGLVTSAVAVVLMGGVCGLSLWTARTHLDAAFTGPFRATTALADRESKALYDTSRADLHGYIESRCPAAGHCGTDENLDPPPTKADLASVVRGASKDLRFDQDRFVRQTARADTAFAARVTVVAGLGLAATALAAFGLRRRIDEYRTGMR